MALYFYKGFSANEKKVSGHIDAQSEHEVKLHLTRQNIFPTQIVLASKSRQGFSFKNLFVRSISTKDKILFTKQLAVLLKSGVPLLQAMELLCDQFEGKLNSVLVDIKDSLKEGSSLANSLGKYPRMFDNTYVQLVKAGEASGKLEVILDRLVEFLERRENISKRIKKAMSYPIMQICFTLGILVFLLIKIVPQFDELFKSQGAELPIQTKILMSISSLFSDHYILLLITTLGLFLSLYYFVNTSKGAYIFDKIKLKIPVIRFFARTGAVVQFCSTLGMLLEGGVNLSDALDIVCKIINNRILADTLNEAKDKIVKQGKISQYLKQTEIFPSIAIYLINTGEQSGHLDQMLLTVAKNYEQELSELTDSLSSKIEPIMLLIMTGAVGFIVMSIMLPVVKSAGMLG